MRLDQEYLLLADKVTLIRIVREKKSLGTDNFTELFIGDFTPRTDRAVFTKKEFTIKVPDWIPSRPLLLGTLLVQGCINSLMQQQIKTGCKDGICF